MTDEEKAEEYTHKTHIKYNDILSQPVVVDEIRKAHIAGLKAGREEQEKKDKEYAEKLSEQHADEWQKQQEVITELKERIEKMKTCSRCMSKDKSLDEYPCVSCVKDGVHTKWH